MTRCPFFLNPQETIRENDHEKRLNHAYSGMLRTCLPVLPAPSWLWGVSIACCLPI